MDEPAWPPPSPVLPFDTFSIRAKVQKLTGAAEGKWQFQWEAPERRAPVVLHVAANAANQDDSEFGDSIHTRELTIRPAK